MNASLLADLARIARRWEDRGFDESVTASQNRIGGNPSVASYSNGVADMCYAHAAELRQLLAEYGA